jgi:hypothetical protein
MKYKNILLATTLSLITAGCGDGNLEKTTEAKPLSFHPKSQEEERAQREKVYTFLFGATYDNKTSILTDSAKTFIKNLWTKLKDKGFTEYDDSLLAGEVKYVRGNVSYKSHDWYSFLPREGRDFTTFFSLPFHEKFILNILEGAEYIEQPNPHVRCEPLLGLKFHNKYLYATKHLPEKAEDIHESSDVYTYYLSDAGTEPDWANPKPSETMVTEVQLEEWNQVFINALKADPFFKQFFEPAALSDGSGSVSLLSARKGSTVVDTVALNVNGMSGSHVDLGLPLYVQLKGSVDHGKSTNLTTGTVAYKLGNTVVGAIQSYANSGTGFGSEGRQLETSVVASHSFGSFFIEGQLGSVSATDVRFKDWSGVRSQVTLGVDTQWMSPFVQLTHRDFGNTTDTATYAGFEVDISELNADTYAFSTHLFTKVGHHSVYGMTGTVEWSGSLTLTSGVSFTTNLSLGTMAEPSAGLTFTLGR